MLKLTRLKETRELAGFSQDELAERSGVARATVADLELGKRMAQPRTARRLAEALEVEIRDLLEEAEGPKDVAPPSPPRSEDKPPAAVEEERREREGELVFWIERLAERFEEFLRGIERGEYHPGDQRHEDLLVAYYAVDWFMDAPKDLRGQLSPEYRAAKERLWRAAHNLRERAVAYGEGGTTAADADLRTRLRARRARGRRSDSGGAADAG